MQKVCHPEQCKKSVILSERNESKDLRLHFGTYGAYFRPATLVLVRNRLRKVNHRQQHEHVCLNE
jgi:hypothetical protein